MIVTFRYAEDHVYFGKTRELAKSWDGRKIRIGSPIRTFPGCGWFEADDACRSDFLWPILEPDLLKELQGHPGICIHMMEEAD